MSTLQTCAITDQYNLILLLLLLQLFIIKMNEMHNKRVLLLNTYVRCVYYRSLSNINVMYRL